MPLTAGTRLGSYEVVALLGSGGMGEVYRAKDTKLGRDVPIKILPERFALDPDRLARSDRETQRLASLKLTELIPWSVPRLAGISINLPVAVFACGIAFALWRETCADRTP